MISIEKPKVLIIDDEPQITKMLSRMLSGRNIDAETASNGDEGMAQVRECRYSLVITDIVMPGASGIEIARYLRQVHRERVPVIGMSGTPWLLDRDNFDAVLAKPFSLDDAWEIIRPILEGVLPNR